MGHDPKGAPTGAQDPALVRFTPEEEAALVQESHAVKAEANALFSSQDYHNALARYHDAAASCPSYLGYELAVLQSNIAACHLKLEQWTEAIKVATEALDGLVEFDKEGHEPGAPGAGSKGTDMGDGQSLGNGLDSDVEQQAASPGALTPVPAPAPSPPRLAVETRDADVLRIRTKALLRRARARPEAGGWQNLAGAEEDYRTLAAMPGLGPADMRAIHAQLRALPPRTKAAQESEMADMWGKLRNLGDGILKPFGLSTQNFQMVKDEKTGGYSVNFTQGGGSSS